MDPEMKSGPAVGDHRARILIVDDDPHSRELLAVMLNYEGFVVRTAASGGEALAIVAQLPPDLILLDVTMPEMDGYEVAAKIKGNLTIQAIPIILVTALDSRNARMLGLGAGADDFLSKPVDCAELCVRVRNLLRLSYVDYRDQFHQGPEAQLAVPPAESLMQPRETGLGEESVRLIGELSLPWQQVVLRMIREIHGQVQGPSSAKE